MLEDFQTQMFKLLNSTGQEVKFYGRLETHDVTNNNGFRIGRLDILALLLQPLTTAHNR
jgi:hypothetical protein